jgi:hypothetical protein
MASIIPVTYMLRVICLIKMSGEADKEPTQLLILQFSSLTSYELFLP